MSSHTKVPEWLTLKEFAHFSMFELTEAFEPELQAFLTRNERPWMVDGCVAIHSIAKQLDTKYYFQDLVAFCHVIEAMQEDYKLLNELPTTPLGVDNG